MIFTILAWLTVVGIPALILILILWFLIKRITSSSPIAYSPVWNRPIWQQTTTETKTYSKPVKEPEFPEITGVEKESFEVNNENVDCRKLTEPGTRVYRIYRSVDHTNWTECDPALTERAACNYAQYLKASNPNEFIRCNDPSGLILFYE